MSIYNHNKNKSAWTVHILGEFSILGYYLKEALLSFDIEEKKSLKIRELSLNLQR